MKTDKFRETRNFSSVEILHLRLITSPETFSEKEEFSNELAVEL